LRQSAPGKIAEPKDAAQMHSGRGDSRKRFFLSVRRPT
jgi:hypothetical protein